MILIKYTQATISEAHLDINKLYKSTYTYGLYILGKVSKFNAKYPSPGSSILRADFIQRS